MAHKLYYNEMTTNYCYFLTCNAPCDAPFADELARYSVGKSHYIPHQSFYKKRDSFIFITSLAALLLLLSPSSSALARQNPQVANQLSKNLILSPSECTS